MTLSPAIVLLSSTWFPPNQRTSATGIGTSLSLLGIAASYLLGPNLVSEPLTPTPENRQTVRNQIDVLLLISFLLELFLLDLVYFTFPKQPPVSICQINKFQDLAQDWLILSTPVFSVQQAVQRYCGSASKQISLEKLSKQLRTRAFGCWLWPAVFALGLQVRQDPWFDAWMEWFGHANS